MKATLERGLSLTQATAINMIDMVGIGPFVTLSFIAAALNGYSCLLAWIIGAVLSFTDGMIWAELGAKWPMAGGSYVFLQKIFKPPFGRMMAFLFVWQTTIQAPLVMASAAIGFSDYFTYLVPLNDVYKKALSGGVILAMMVLLYRRIGKIGNISIVLSIITAGTILWIIVSGFLPFKPIPFISTEGLALAKPLGFAALALASQKAIYSYLGYYNVCHLGGEIKAPEINIPRAIFISITGIAFLYIMMQLAVLKVLPWQLVAESKFPVSLYFNQLYNSAVAKFATGFILIIALSSLFSVMLGYSRVPYAAALDGNFFKVFGRLHTRLHFPHYSLLAMGSLAFIFSLLFRLSEVIAAIISMRILIQFVAQAIGVIGWHRRLPDDDRPFKMPFFPWPAVISMSIWFFILFFSGWYILFALGIIALGLDLYRIKETET